MNILLCMCFFFFFFFFFHSLQLTISNVVLFDDIVLVFLMPSMLGKIFSLFEIFFPENFSILKYFSYFSPENRL